MPENLPEDQVYPPSREFSLRAHVPNMDAYRALYRHAQEAPEEFWARLAEEELSWFKKWSQVHRWNPPFAE